jgi:hypothetical protein
VDILLPVAEGEEEIETINCSPFIIGILDSLSVGEPRSGLGG